MKNAEYITKAMNQETFELRDMENFYTWEETQPFMIEVGKQARKIAQAHEDSFIAKMMMKEIENDYFKALHADCGFTMHASASHAMGYFKEMIKTFGIN